MEKEQRSARLRAMMAPYADPRHRVVGFDLHRGAVAYLASAPRLGQAAPEDEIFEIASITKVFTALLLCLLVEEGKIDPKAPLRQISDGLSMVPDWVTPESLATHRSGLPVFYMPVWKALLQGQKPDPYADFTRADLLDWLRNWQGRKPPRPHVYSNLGMGLLGEAMAMARPFLRCSAPRSSPPWG